MPSAEDAVDGIVRGKFDTYSIDKKTDSNNGRHYVLQKNGDTFHLKLVSKKYIERNDESEIELLKQIESDYVVKLLDSGAIDGEWSYLLFPHINGRTLDKLATDEGWGDEQLSKLLRDVLQGFKDMGKVNIIHRDIKPKNIMYDNRNQRYVILDLGIGCYTRNPTKDSTKIPRGIGAKFYTAPEQFKIAIDEQYSITQATDVFSLGVIVYELAMAKHPFITPSNDNVQYYANLIFEVNPELIPVSTGISEKIRNAILKMLAREPSRRFLTIDELLVDLELAEKDDSTSKSKLYLKMPSIDKEVVVQYALDNPDAIEAVVLSPTDGQDIADKLDEAGVKIFLDSSIYKLQTDKEQKVLSNKLGIKYTAKHNILTIYKIKDELMLGSYNLADKMHSEIVSLPYFKVDGQESLILTREIWSEARGYYASKSLPQRELYGGIVIPHNVVVNDTERTLLMSKLMGCHDLDGLILTLEDTNVSAATTVDQAFIEGSKELIHFFESQFKKVILIRNDISTIALVHHSSYTGGWSKGFRHFLSSRSGGGGGNNDYKMKFYAPKLFTFVEEKSKIQTIVLMGKSDYLVCECDSCSVNSPLSTSYQENELQERTHYFNSLVELQRAVTGRQRLDRKQYFVDYLQDCSDAGEDIKTAGVLGSETIPSYIGFVSSINN